MVLPLWLRISTEIDSADLLALNGFEKSDTLVLFEVLGRPIIFLDYCLLIIRGESGSEEFLLIIWTLVVSYDLSQLKVLSLSCELFDIYYVISYISRRLLYV